MEGLAIIRKSETKLTNPIDLARIIHELDLDR